MKTKYILIMVLSVLVFWVTTVDAKPKGKSCPAGEVVVGFDDGGNLICATNTKLNPGDFACPCFDKVIVQGIIRGYRGWAANLESQCLRDVGGVRYIGCSTIGPNPQDCFLGEVAAGERAIIEGIGASTDSVLECYISDEKDLLPVFGDELPEPGSHQFAQALMHHRVQACMDIILEVMEEEGCPREDDCGNGVLDEGEECDWHDEEDCTSECLFEP